MSYTRNPRPQDVLATLQAINGRHTYLGTISSADGSVKNNSTTSSTFEIPAGSVVMLQGSADFYVAVGSLPTATTSNSLKVAADSYYQLTMGNSDTIVQVVAGGAVDVKVFKVS